MYTSINIDAAVEHIKYIVDNIRCAICDKTDGTRMRYACGHTSCQDCVVVAADCSVCLTPPLGASRKPVADKPFTHRAENAVNLLNIFQNEFHIDVYKRQRLSEQLKVEKELFPDCIQAPAKYFNKRKSYNKTKSNKENRLSQLPGEEVSIRGQKMEQSKGNVERWLKKYVRKPFADLNSNNEILRTDVSVFKKQDVTENSTIEKSTRKRSHIKTALTNKYQTNSTPVKKRVYHKKPRFENSLSVKPDTSRYFKTGDNSKPTDNDKSGIDNDAVIFIDDSQSIIENKDLNACLAVHEAENKQDKSTFIISSKPSELMLGLGIIERATEAKVEHTTKVPFFLKGYLSEKCIDCNAINIDKSDTCSVEPTQHVSITVENQSFTAIIKVTSNENATNKMNTKQSVEVQTDVTESDNAKEFVKEMSTVKTCHSPSKHLFNDDENIHDDNVAVNIIRSVNKTQNVVIEESDSDGELDASVSLQVTADVHRSCDEIDYRILADVENLGEHSKRPRRVARGFTPTSTDSSDKENYNPNRKKKALTSKKKPMKK